MIKNYIKYSLAILANLGLVFFVAPSLINLHENITTLVGLAIWWIQPVVLIVIYATFIKHQQKDTNTNA